MDSQIYRKYNNGNEEINYYNSAELDYFKLNMLNQPDNHLNVYYIQDYNEYKCQYCKS